MLKVKITNTGLYLPPIIQTSKELAPLIGVDEDWIIERTGIYERRIANEPMDVMAAYAAKDAINGGTPPDLIINASTSPMQLIPDSSVFIQRALGYDGIPSWSIHATCLSFLVAFNTASSLIHTGLYKKILIVSSEAGSPWRNFKEPESAALFGDAAAAVILEPSLENEESCWIDSEMNTYPKGAELTEFRGAGIMHPPDNPMLTKEDDNYFSMQGTKIYRFALVHVRKTLETLMNRNNLKPQDIQMFIPHQASGHAIEAAQMFGFDNSKIANIIRNYGNCVSASIPMALAMFHKEGKIKRGDLCIIGGTGAGLSVAFTLIKF